MSENKTNLSSSLLEDNENDDLSSPLDHKLFLKAGFLPSYTREMPLNTSGFESKVNRSIGSFSMSPPPLSMSPPPLSTFGSQNQSLSSAFHIPLCETKERIIEVSPTKNLWKVTDSSVPTLPERHPLERTSVFVPHTSASTVASRVTDVIRERSIISKFSDEKAKVKCITSYNVEFRIRLYRGKGEFCHGIIVEVQRRFGFSHHFHSDTQAILDAVKGKIELSRSLPHPSVSDNESSGSAPLPPSLDLISSLISSEKYDSQILAINGLTILTDSAAVGRVRADQTIKCLLSKENEALCSYIFDAAESCHVQRYEHELAKSSVVKQDVIREKAMIVVARIVKHPNTATRECVKSLSRTLLSNLKKANEDIKLALHSASIILEMLKNSYNESLPNSTEILDAMNGTCSIGEIENKQLSEISNRCIELLIQT